jgi:hypothetical protein
MAHRAVCPRLEMTRAGTVIYDTVSLSGVRRTIHAFVTETRHYDLYHNGNPRFRLDRPSDRACRAPRSPQDASFEVSGMSRALPAPARPRQRGATGGASGFTTGLGTRPGR